MSVSVVELFKTVNVEYQHADRIRFPFGSMDFARQSLV